MSRRIAACMAGLSLLLVLIAASGCKDRSSPPAPRRQQTPPRAEPPGPVSSADRAVRWRADLRALGQTLPARHKNAFHHLSSQQWRKEIAALEGKLAGLDDAQSALELSRLVSRLGDSHTRMQLPRLARLPLSRPGWFPWRMPTTAAGRSVSPPPNAGSSA